MGSKVDIKTNKVLGKNAPKRKDLDRPKGVASIPAQSIAPPEDKTLTSTYETEVRESFRTDAHNTGIRKSDYLAKLEKSLNPNVGPGSYDPVLVPKLNSTNTQDWSRGPERFKLEQKDKSPTHLPYQQDPRKP
jgi:hypothetical protein